MPRIAHPDEGVVDGKVPHRQRRREGDERAGEGPTFVRLRRYQSARAMSNTRHALPKTTS
jgi:hypothetical protein